jgi:hypothetical protein
MGQVYYPGQNFESKSVQVYGTNIQVDSTINNPYVIFKVDGITYPSGFTVTYTAGFRRFYATVDSNRNIYITCYTIAYGQDIPAYDLNNVEIYVVGQLITLADPPIGALLYGTPYLTYDPYEGGEYYLSLNFYKVSNALSYNIYVKQGATWYLASRTASTNFAITMYFRVFDYNPYLSMDIKVVSLGTDGIEYGVSSIYTMQDYNGSYTYTEYFMPGRFTWVEYTAEGGSWQGTAVLWAGQTIPYNYSYQTNQIINSADGYTYVRGQLINYGRFGNEYKVSREPYYGGGGDQQ